MYSDVHDVSRVTLLILTIIIKDGNSDCGIKELTTSIIARDRLIAF